MCKVMVQSDRPQMTQYYGACWMAKAKDTDQEYVIFIDFPKQQRFCERASMLSLHYSLSY